MYQEMNPVYMAQALSFSSQLIGYAMAFSGGSLLLFTYFVQPWFLRTFAHRRMCMVCAVSCCAVFLHMPSIHTLIRVVVFGSVFGGDSERTMALVFTFVNSLGGVVFASIMFVCSMCWVNNAVPNHCVGRANGIAQSLAALVRAVGPALTGFIWSASVNSIESNTVAVFYAYLPSFALMVLIAVEIFFFIGDDMQLTVEQRAQKNKAEQTFE